ncbi:cytochrome c [Psychrosphaera aquimarina]|uniref:Cytochrome c n=1 Tax=Psychrosphaera aquimarina TaxID=2044854 RepID=A0ABU3QY78_9GAMM|nr:cytochrome c [Psychrosphaera aquimarina]MDU0112380.1 cytochrome c [Psychrosphaera aquimarina]
MKKIIALSTMLFTSVAFNANAADIAAGKAKSATCAACHGANGISMIPMYPNLAGQKVAYLEKQLRDFKSGARKDPVMSAMAMPLSEEDIKNVSAYFASLK